RRANVLGADYLAELEAGDTGVLGVAIYIEDRYSPEMALRVALDQVARIHAESDASGRFPVCKTYKEIRRARQAGKIGLLLTMQGVEPHGSDLDLVRIFYELAAGAIGLPH